MYAYRCAVATRGLLLHPKTAAGGPRHHVTEKRFVLNCHTLAFEPPPTPHTQHMLIENMILSGFGASIGQCEGAEGERGGGDNEGDPRI